MHRVSVGNTVCVGAGVANHCHHYYHGGRRHHYRVHAWQRHCAQRNSGAAALPFGKKVVCVTKSGKELDEDTVRTRMRIGVPVHVHYVGEGDDMMVDRVELDED
jgi:hypothetical protein